MADDTMPWYEMVEGPELQQGDFFPNCPVLVPLGGPPLPTNGEWSPGALAAGFRVAVRTYDIVVMSQSCDMEQRKLDLVLVCPHWPLSELENVEDEAVRNFFRSRKGKEEMRRGYVPAYHMLAASELEGFEREIQVVDFRTVFSVPFDFLTDWAQRGGTRMRLLSPYREHLSQAFARFFMRVGLPANIPPFR